MDAARFLEGSESRESEVMTRRESDYRERIVKRKTV
jgi:hypothetical protein